MSGPGYASIDPYFICVCLLFFLRCGGAIENPHDYDVTDRLAWEALNASFEEHGVVLQSPDGAIPALIRRRATSLLQNRVYRLSLRVKALGESSGNLHADLYLGEHYDSPDQELVVQMQDPGSGSRRFERLLNSGRFNEVPFVRVFTFSQTPILVEEIALEEVR